MLQPMQIANLVDKQQNPAGGHVTSIGLTIMWQDGPLGFGADRKPANGCFVETILFAAQQRLEFYQRSKFNCDENKEAIEYIQSAIDMLESRTLKRIANGVEGTHKL